jgi:hypothetical protein
MNELSNAVTVLIARMESHPEDFAMHGMNKAKFADTAEALYELAGVTEGKGRASAYWFLSDADKEALLEAWKKFHCVRMEQRVMEAIFDDGAEEREREMQRAKISMLQAQAHQQHMNAQMQRSMMQGSYPNSTLFGAQGAATLTGLGNNAAQSSILGSGMAFHNAANSNITISTGSLTVGKETIDEDLITKLKKWVGEK